MSFIKSAPVAFLLLFSSIVTAGAGDWPAFLARHDFVWQTLPNGWGNSAFIGNGDLGATIFLQKEAGAADGSEQFSWEINRAGFYVGNSRMPVGRIALKTAGELVGGDTRLDLWNAEAHGTLRTTRGEVRWRSAVLRGPDVLLIEAEGAGDEPPPALDWHPAPALPPHFAFTKKTPAPGEILHPPAEIVTTATGFVGTQIYREQGDAAATELDRAAIADAGPRRVHAATALVVASKTLPAAGNKRVFLVAMEHAADAATARDRAGTALDAAGVDTGGLIAAHRAWWHDYYRLSRVELPDSPALEAFYWRQIYKLGSAMRPDGPICDLMGPWYRETAFPRIWWNLNVQLTYQSLAASNRLELAESLFRNLDRHREQLIDNVRPPRPERDAAVIGRTSAQDLRSPFDIAAPGDRPQVAQETGNLPWVLFLYWEYYRAQMDDAILRDRLFPLLALSAGAYMTHIETENTAGTGIIHLKPTHSPEFATAPDAHYDLALFRWELQTLVAACERLKLDDPRLPLWRDTLARLAPFPVDEKTGFLIGRDRPLDRAHRHYSHLFAFYPLCLLDLDDPVQRALATRSLDHWLTVPGNDRTTFTITGAASMLALLGRGDDALAQLDCFMALPVRPRPFLRPWQKLHPNTFYSSDLPKRGVGGPEIESPLAVISSVNDLLLQSQGGVLRVFPAMPAAWRDARFENLRAEGAFLVSGEWRGGRAVRVEIKSLAGESCRLRVPGWTADNTRIAASADGTARKITASPDGSLQISLAKGGSVVIEPASH